MVLASIPVMICVLVVLNFYKEILMSSEALTDLGVWMRPEVAKPILDQIVKQMRTVLDMHTDKTVLSAVAQSDLQHLQTLYATICQDFIGSRYFYELPNFQLDVTSP
jgi:hypothetical protein